MGKSSRWTPKAVFLSTAPGARIGEERPPLAFYIFDLLHHNRTDLLGKPLHERRRRLSLLLRKAADPIRESAEIHGDPNKLLHAVRRLGLEGSSAKCAIPFTSPAAAARMVKLKCVSEQELVIGGYTRRKARASTLGAARRYYRGKQLRFAGKVGPASMWRC